MEAYSKVYLGDLFIFISAPQRGDEVYPTLDVGIPGNSRLNAGKHAVNPIFLDYLAQVPFTNFWPSKYSRFVIIDFVGRSEDRSEVRPVLL